MRRLLLISAGVFALAAMLSVGAAVASAPVITNGGFETNDFTGWNVNNQDQGGWFTYKGHPLPPKAGEFPAPPRGKYAAFSDQGSSSTMILSQVFKVPPKATLQFLTYYQNTADNFATPADLDAEDDMFDNQQYRVDLMDPKAPIKSVDKGDILKTLFRTKAGDPLDQKPEKITTSLKKFAGEKVRLRFAVSVNENVLLAGVDAVKVKTAK